ncbi:MAG: DUF4258 domain-containing protein [Anaerolineae bacterium]|nr:DUF4258 domain-containing protein [Anaerolineae bacterium]
MAFIIRANHKDYTVTYHAAQRMLERYISEEMIIDTLENGELIEQAHGIDLYKLPIYEDILEAMVIVRIAVEETSRTIVSVIDDTGED